MCVEMKGAPSMTEVERLTDVENQGCRLMRDFCFVLFFPLGGKKTKNFLTSSHCIDANLNGHTGEQVKTKLSNAYTKNEFDVFSVSFSPSHLAGQRPQGAG